MGKLQLQKDYTTPEQSKRLLNLGVPKWTANYKYPLVGCCSGESILDTENVISCDYVCNGEIPVWSVGRLIEIIGICHLPSAKGMFMWTSDMIEHLLNLFETMSLINGFDFSKLEDL